MKKFQGKNLKEGLDVSSVGIEMAAAIILGYFLGHWFDGEFDAAPWGTVFFMAAGVGAAIKALVRVTKQARRVMSRADDSEARHLGYERRWDSSRDDRRWEKWDKGYK